MLSGKEALISSGKVVLMSYSKDRRIIANEVHSWVTEMREHPDRARTFNEFCRMLDLRVGASPKAVEKKLEQYGLRVDAEGTVVGF